LLAAWITTLWPADELVLLKSVPVPVRQTTLQASQNLNVDAYFPDAARLLKRISWCNVRETDPIIEPWLIDSANPV
jgi:hypothetical protein